MSETLNQEIISATKWSTLTEVAAKLISPITNMILARLLTPQIFGVVAAITLVTSFADMLTDAGFQRCLIQHEFENENDLYRYMNVAFWSNLSVSVILWGIIAAFSNPIANQVGCPGLGHVLIVASTVLILTSFSSIQMAYYKRHFDFRTLFFVRIAGVCIPLLLTVPLALLGFGYWSLIIASICQELLNAAFLTAKSKWKPSLFYSFGILKAMLSFSLWALLESLGKWLKDNIAVLIVGSTLSVYYIGLYKTSILTIVGIMGLIYSPLVPVAYSALSRVQNDGKRFKEIFLDFQLTLSLFMLPIGIIVLLYNETVTFILLGSQWGEAAGFLGLYCFMSAFMHVFCDMSLEAFRAKGCPKLGVLSIFIYLAVLLPLLRYSAGFGFSVLYHATAYSLFAYIIACVFLMDKCFKITFYDFIKKSYPVVIASAVMTGTGCLLKLFDGGFVWSLFSTCICTFVYLVSILCFPQTRKAVEPYLKKIVNEKKNNIEKRADV